MHIFVQKRQKFDKIQKKQTFLQTKPSNEGFRFEFQYFTNQINFTQLQIHFTQLRIHFMQLRISFFNFFLSGPYFCYYQRPEV